MTDVKSLNYAKRSQFHSVPGDADWGVHISVWQNKSGVSLEEIMCWHIEGSHLKKLCADTSHNTYRKHEVVPPTNRTSSLALSMFYVPLSFSKLFSPSLCGWVVWRMKCPFVSVVHYKFKKKNQKSNVSVSVHKISGGVLALSYYWMLRGLKTICWTIMHLFD